MSSLEKGEDLKRISINSAYSPTASVTIDIPVTTIVPNKRKTSPIAVSPSGSYVALFDDGKDSISVWMMSKNGLEPVSEVNVNSSTNYQGFAISDYGYLASGHDKQQPQLEPDLTTLRTSFAFCYTFLPSGEFVVVNDLGIHRYCSEGDQWKDNATSFEWSSETEEAVDRRTRRRRVQYSIINRKLICAYDDHLTQWDLGSGKMEMEYYLDNAASLQERRHNEENYIIAIDSNSTLSALITQDDDSQKLTVYWVQTALPMATVQIVNDADDCIVAMEFIESSSCILLATITKMGKAMLWNPHGLKWNSPSGDIGEPLDTFNLQEYSKLTEWLPGLTFTLSRGIILTSIDGIPTVLHILTKHIENYRNNLFNAPLKATLIRDLVTIHSDNLSDTHNLNGRFLQWTISRRTGLRVYKDSCFVCSITAQKFEYFGWVKNSTILDNDELLVLTNRCLCIFFLDGINDTIEISYYWDDDRWPAYRPKFSQLSLINALERKEGAIWWDLLFEKYEHASGPLPSPSFKSIWWHKQNAMEDSSMQRIRIFNNLIRMLTSEENLAKYGYILLPEAIKQHDDVIVETIVRTCIDLFCKNSIMYIGLLQIITASLPKLCEYYPDQTAFYFSKIRLILEPRCHSINRLKLPARHLYAFSRRFGRPDDFSYLDTSQVPEVTSTYLDLLFNVQQLVSPLQSNISLTIIWLRYAGLYAFIYIRNTLITFMYRILIPITYSVIRVKRRSTLTLVVGLPRFCAYPPNYSFLKDFLFPASSPFVTSTVSDNRDLFRTWDGEALINFKWQTFGLYYYIFIWIQFIALFVCFAATMTDGESALVDKPTKRNLVLASAILTVWHLHFEVRQFIWNPVYYVLSPWNWIDCGAFGFPLVTSLFFLQGYDVPRWMSAFSILLLWMKFLLLIRPFKYFGIYIAIIFGVAQQVFSFLVVLGIMIVGFAHAFFVLLRPMPNSSFNTPPSSLDGEDPNDPWQLTPTYSQMLNNGTLVDGATLIQDPDANTNMYSWFGSSLLGVYRFLAGDWSSFDGWNARDNPELAVMMVAFSFFTVIYLMNLFIGLLGNAINTYHEHGSYLAQKAEVLAEIELFYLLPHQRRSTWFPDMIYFEADTKELRQVMQENVQNNPNYLRELPKHTMRILKIFGYQIS
ncbi:5076_t:CDS:2 [Paraglomus brasilianum]|uniref:5076_t:CDS:1 n=1 Tax=Paraglomus brasilianum TaxID=144538 RepID=A0A9N9FAH6_9GLOM|nr:5076_t:CDS:2 [Paraglomus brasilianum]